MKSQLLLLTACVLVSVASSAPGLVDLQKYVTWQQNHLDTASDEDSFDTTYGNRDMATLKQFENHRRLTDKLSSREQAFQDNNVERYGKISGQTTADGSVALFQALRLAALQTLPEQTREQFWRAMINNIMAQLE